MVLDLLATGPLEMIILFLRKELLAIICWYGSFDFLRMRLVRVKGEVALPLVELSMENVPWPGVTASLTVAPSHSKSLPSLLNNWSRVTFRI